jgi:hypothetical protein
MSAQKILRSTKLSPPTVRFSTRQHEQLSKAITALDQQFDPSCALLIHPAAERFRSVAESLCYAALLLVEQSREPAPDPARIERANAIIDAILATQITTDPASGVFPLAWAPEGGATDLVDLDTRQTVGSMLGLLAKRFPDCLGQARVQQTDIALHRCCRGEHPKHLEAAHLQMMHAWMDQEYGYDLGGENLAARIAQHKRKCLRADRFADPWTLCQQLWSVGLWFQNAKLVNCAARIGWEMWQDVIAWRHPDLMTFFGAGVRVDSVSQDDSPGLERIWQWLNWLELVEHSDHSNPRVLAELAKPVLAAQHDATAVRKVLDAQPEERAISEQFPGLHLSGWFEKNLHIEVAQRPENQRRAIVMAAYWPSRSGGLARLRCRTTKGNTVSCDKRFVRLLRPGTVDIQISGLGPGESRMIEEGWWLAGLHMAAEGFQITEARRTEDGLRLRLKATVDQPLLFFAPLPE